MPAVINQILNDPPDLDPLTGDLRAIIGDCLAKAPGSRPRASDLVARFSHLEAGPDAAVIAAPVPVPAPAAVAVPEP